MPLGICRLAFFNFKFERTVMQGSSRRISVNSVSANLSGGDGKYLNMILKPGAGKLYSPTMNQSTVIRILPGVNPDNPTMLDPWRLPTNMNEFGQWFFPIQVAESVKDPNSERARTWVMHDPYDRFYDISSNPLMMIRSAADEGTKKRLPFSVGWASLLLNYGPYNSPAIPAKPKLCWLVQCLLMSYKGEDFQTPKGLAPDDSAQFMLLKPSVYKNLRSAMDERTDYRGDSSNVSAHFVCGDPIALDEGSYVTIFTEGQDPRRASLKRTNQFTPGMLEAAGRNDKTIKGFDVFLEKEYKGFSADLSSVSEVVTQKIKDWSSCVNIMSNEEQVLLVQDLYSGYPSLLVYALDDRYGQYLNPKIRAEGLQQLGKTKVTSIPAPEPSWADVAVPAAVVAEAPPAPAFAKPALKSFSLTPAKTISSEAISPPTSGEFVPEEATNDANNKVWQNIQNARKAVKSRLPNPSED